MSQQNYDIIIKKLDAFIDKYYKNLIIKGSIWFLAFALSLFIIVAISEYMVNFSSGIRKILFYSYIITFILWFSYSVLWPLSGLLKFRKRLSHQEAAQMIGHHFPEVGDQLSNILQLKELSEIDSSKRALIEAGIDQKSIKIYPLPILKAINFKGNIKYVRYALIPLFIIILTWILRPQYVEEPAKRLIEYNQEFERSWPFSIQILNEDLSAFQKEDFDLKIKINGTEWPEQLFLHYNQSRYLLKKYPEMFIIMNLKI